MWFFSGVKKIYLDSFLLHLYPGIKLESALILTIFCILFGQSFPGAFKYKSFFFTHSSPFSLLTSSGQRCLSPPPPGSCLHFFIASRVQQFPCLSSFVNCCSLTLSRFWQATLSSKKFWEQEDKIYRIYTSITRRGSNSRN